MMANKLKKGDEIRVVAPSRSLSIVKSEIIERAIDTLTGLGFKVTFSDNCREVDENDSSCVNSRVSDLENAFNNKNVKCILTAIGGFNVNQIIDKLDYTIIKNNPKIICGYSDITALLNAIYEKTGLVTYLGPHFSTFGLKNKGDYTVEKFLECTAEINKLELTSADNNYYIIQNGCVEGEAIGGNLCTLNLLQGTEFMPSLKNKILFLEDDNIVGKYFAQEFDRNLQSLLQVEGGNEIRGIVFGKFEESCGLAVDKIGKIVREKVEKNIPIVCNVDFGHVFPIATIPIGGNVKLNASKYGVQILFENK